MPRILTRPVMVIIAGRSTPFWRKVVGDIDAALPSMSVRISLMGFEVVPDLSLENSTLHNSKALSTSCFLATVLEEEMRILIWKTVSEIESIVERRLKVTKDLDNYHCIGERELHYYSLVSEFWLNTLPHLLALARGEFEDVRIVFWFDN